MSAGMSRFFDWQKVTDFCTDRITFVPGTKSPTRVQVGLCDLADEDTIVL